MQRLLLHPRSARDGWCVVQQLGAFSHSEMLSRLPSNFCEGVGFN